MPTAMTCAACGLPMTVTLTHHVGPGPAYCSESCRQAVRVSLTVAVVAYLRAVVACQDARADLQAADASDVDTTLLVGRLDACRFRCRDAWNSLGVPERAGAVRVLKAYHGDDFDPTPYR